MSSGSEHRECSFALGAYALGALPEAEGERLRRHLSGCRECRAELDWLRAAVDALPASVPPVDPPAELKARLMEIVNAEAQLLRAAGELADHPQPDEEPRPRGWWRTRVLAPGLALAAICAAVAVVVVTTAGGASTRTIHAQVSSSVAGGRAQAFLRIRGPRADLVVTGLATPPANHVDELWVKRGEAPPEPAGTFVVQTGSVAVARPVHPGDVVMVTVEPGRGSAAPTTAPFIVAKT